MIYQLTAYYGALIGNKVVYSAEINLNDCTKPFDVCIDEKLYKQYITEKIIVDGFNPTDFTFDWLTKEQYENKIDSKIDE